MSFDSLGLTEPLLRAISAADYTTPTPIQRKAIPPIAEGRDVLGCAQTGTGKTAAFAIPLIQRLDQARRDASASYDPHRPRDTRAPKVLVLAPTRELAIQINASFAKYARRTKLRGAVIYGGVSQHQQTTALRRGVDVIVATPGRLLDLMQQGFVDLSYIESVVLDEADHMLDMGFLPDVRKILSALPEDRQTLLFSATMPPDIKKLAEQNMSNPFRIRIAVTQSNAIQIDQSVYRVEAGEKSAFLIRLLRTQPSGSTLIFSRTKRNADNLTRKLNRAGIGAEAIHSNKSQNNRQRTLGAFRSGKVNVLVATDIAARGIDVRGITYVINYDLPDVAETYTHRIGRTGRAGQPGQAITLCDHSNHRGLRQLERHLGYRLQPGTLLNDATGASVEQASGADLRLREAVDAPARRSAKTNSGRSASGGPRKRTSSTDAAQTIGSSGQGEVTPTNSPTSAPKPKKSRTRRGTTSSARGMTAKAGAAAGKRRARRQRTSSKSQA